MTNSPMFAQSTIAEDEGPSVLPLSLYEERVWFAQVQEPEAIMRQLVAYRVGAGCDLDRLATSLEQLSDIWPELGARYEFSEDGTLRKIAGGSSPAMLLVLEASGIEGAISLLHEQQAAPFDMQSGQAFQAVIVHYGDENILAFLKHKLLAERLSKQALLDAVIAIYDGQSPSLPKPRRLEAGSVAAVPLTMLARLNAAPLRFGFTSLVQQAPSSQRIRVDLAPQIIGLDNIVSTEAVLAKIGARFALFLLAQGDTDTINIRSTMCTDAVMPLADDSVATLSISCDQSMRRTEELLLSSLQQGTGQREAIASFTIHPLADGASLQQSDGLPLEELALPSLQNGLGMQLAVGLAGNGDICLELTLGKEISHIAASYLFQQFVAALEGGKIDSNLVPLIKQTTLRPAVSSAAENDMPSIILNEFRTALDVAEMGPDDDFFDFGGHSLIATRIIGRLQSNHGIELRFSDLFSHPTANRLATQARRSAGLNAPAAAQQVPTQHSLTAPLSLAQMSLWKAYAAFGFGEIFNIPFALDFLDPVDEDAFECAFLDVIERHPALRTHFYQKGDTVEQRIVPMHDVPDYKWFWTSEESHGVDRHSEAKWHFDLSRELPMRLRFLRDPQTGRQILSFLFHHIVLDEWSVNLMMAELSEAYRARASGATPSFTTLTAPFHEFARKQRAEEVNLQHLTFWTDMLRGAPKELNLQLDAGASQLAGQDDAPSGGWVEFKLERDVCDGLYATAKHNSASLFNVVYAAIVTALHRLGGLTDIVVGTSASGRNDSHYFDTIGYFTTVVAHRLAVGETMTIGELIGSVKDMINGSLEHSEVPIDLVEEALGMVPGRDHLFEVFIQIHAKNKLNGTLSGPNGKRVEFRQIDPDKHESILGLQFEVMEETIGEERSIRILMSYRSDRYSPLAVEQLRGTTSQVFSGFAKQNASDMSLASII